jgi:hypothetical protein
MASRNCLSGYFRQLAAEQFLMSRAYDVPAMLQVLTGHAILASGSLPLIIAPWWLFARLYVSCASASEANAKNIAAISTVKEIAFMTRLPLDQPILKAYQFAN